VKVKGVSSHRRPTSTKTAGWMGLIIAYTLKLEYADLEDICKVRPNC